jgi:hypothetical protein
MDEACRTSRRNENIFYKILKRKSEWKRPLGGTDADGRIAIKLILTK